MSVTNESLYIRLHDEIVARERLQVRFEAMESFIKNQYPQFFAGEDLKLIADPKLKPILISFGKPQEEIGDDGKWK